jgi:putative membrane protein
VDRFSDRSGVPTGLLRAEEGYDMIRTSSTIVAWALVAAAPWLWPCVASAQERPYGGGWGMHPMWGVWGVWHVGMMLMMLVFWGVVIAGIVLAIRWLTRQGREPRTDTALDILRQRYARGDISKEEFEAKKRDLA